MHHFEDFDVVDKPEGSFDVIYTNKSTGGKITLTIPKAGVLENSDRQVSEDDIRGIAQEVGKVLSRSLVLQNYLELDEA